MVTGAGSGIGLATVRALAGMGMRVAMLGRDAGKLEAGRRSLGELGGSCRVWACDVKDRAGVSGTVEGILGDWGSIEVLVCNAGVNIPNRAMSALSPEDWDELIAANLTGAYNITRAVLPSMRERREGLIVQVSSISGMRAGPLGGVAYSASKYGQAALGICVGREERQNGIRSTVIYPGEVDTPILDKRPKPVDADRRKLILQPEDVAAAIRFLAELPPRAHIFEMVIKPTVDDFA